MMSILEEQQRYMSRKYGNDLLLSYGPGHIVYDDSNLDDHAILFCIDKTQELLADPGRDDRMILEDTLWLLECLLSIPEDKRG